MRFNSSGLTGRSRAALFPPVLTAVTLLRNALPSRNVPHKHTLCWNRHSFATVPLPSPPPPAAVCCIHHELHVAGASAGTLGSTFHHAATVRHRSTHGTGSSYAVAFGSDTRVSQQSHRRNPPRPFAAFLFLRYALGFRFVASSRQSPPVRCDSRQSRVTDQCRRAPHESGTIAARDGTPSGQSPGPVSRRGRLTRFTLHRTHQSLFTNPADSSARHGQHCHDDGDHYRCSGPHVTHSLPTPTGTYMYTHTECRLLRTPTAGSHQRVVYSGIFAFACSFTHPSRTHRSI